MLDYGDLFQKYDCELEKICDEKNCSDYQKRILKEYLKKLIVSYEPELNILEHTPLEEYIKNCIENIRKVKKINVFTINEILTDKENYFYKKIKLTKDMNAGFHYNFKKSNGSYILDEGGEYSLTSVGVCDFGKLEVQLIKKENMLETFHHELRHINQATQGKNIIYYPSIYPYFYEFSIMLIEGEAEYHRRLFTKDIMPLNYKHEEKNFRVNYELYYQLYMLLMFVLPKELKEKIDNGSFELTGISSEQLDFLSEIFAIITLLLAKGTERSAGNTINEAMKSCYYDCMQMLVINNDTLKTKKRRANQIQEDYEKYQKIMAILKDEEKLKKNYEKVYETSKMKIMQKKSKEEREALLKELEQKGTIKQFESFLNSQKESFKESIIFHQNLDELDETLSKREIIMYKFGGKLATEMKKLTSQKILVEDLYQLLVTKVETYVFNQEGDRTDQINFINQLKHLEEKKSL